MHHASRTWLVVAATAATISTGGHADARSGTEITASFTDSCRDVAVHASKDISHVVIRYADGRVVKDETIDSPDYALDGGPGDEIASVIVKASVTSETFDCHAGGSTPVALLETRRCEFGVCNDWTAIDTDDTPGRCNHFADAIPFRGINSTDPDSDIVSWSIDFGDGTASASGTWAGSPPVEVGHTFAVRDLVTVTLTLVDATGLVATDTIVVCLTDFTPD